jgi:hypothetical protein
MAKPPITSSRQISIKMTQVELAAAGQMINSTRKITKTKSDKTCSVIVPMLIRVDFIISRKSRNTPPITKKSPRVACQRAPEGRGREKNGTASGKSEPGGSERMVRLKMIRMMERNGIWNNSFMTDGAIVAVMTPVMGFSKNSNGSPVKIGSNFLVTV